MNNARRMMIGIGTPSNQSSAPRPNPMVASMNFELPRQREKISDVPLMASQVIPCSMRDEERFPLDQRHAFQRGRPATNLVRRTGARQHVRVDHVDRRPFGISDD